jgi:hypothetical protein
MDRVSETDLPPVMREGVAISSKEGTDAGVATGCHGVEDPCLQLLDHNTKADKCHRAIGYVARQAIVPCTTNHARTHQAPPSSNHCLQT